MRQSNDQTSVDGNRSSKPSETQLNDWKNNMEINIYREYLRIPTAHPDVNYSNVIGCAQT